VGGITRGVFTTKEDAIRFLDKLNEEDASCGCEACRTAPRHQWGAWAVRDDGQFRYDNGCAAQQVQLFRVVEAETEIVKAIQS
jgi:hypothetical protein